MTKFQFEPKIFNNYFYFSIQFLLNSKGYLLADDNYDVWLGNTRGNIYSCNHSLFDPFGADYERQMYWTFSWHQMGMSDLPTMIDFVLDKTGQKKMQFIAHSQGTTAFFVMASRKPEYNDKIEMMHALAPVAFLSHTTSPPIRAIAPFATVVKVRKHSLLIILYLKFSSYVGSRSTDASDNNAKYCFNFLLENKFIIRHL